MKTLLALLLAALSLAAHGADFTLLDRHSARALVAPPSDGRPTVIALWASDCPYCKQNLRALASLEKRHPRLRIITVAAEIPTELTKPELDKTGLQSERYAYGNDTPEAIAYALDPTWQRELPRTLLFTAQGQREARSGALNAAAFRQALGL